MKLARAPLVTVADGALGLTNVPTGFALKVRLYLDRVGMVWIAANVLGLVEGLDLCS